MSAKWRQAVEQSPLYRTPRGTDHGGNASDRSVRQLWSWLAWKSEHRRNSGLVTGWTLHQAAQDTGMSYPTAKRALARLQRDGMYVALIRGSSCGAPGERRRVIKSVGLLKPVPLHGDVGPIDVEDQRRLLTMHVFSMTTRKRSPLRMNHPLIVRLSAYNSGQPLDQKGSVKTPEGISGDTRRDQSDPLLRPSRSTYQVHAPTVASEPVPDSNEQLPPLGSDFPTAPDSNEQLPRDSDESLAIEPSADRRDAEYWAEQVRAAATRARATA